MGRLIIFLAVAGLGMILLLGPGVGSAVSAADNPPGNPQILEFTCTECHGLEQILEKNLYMAEWQKLVDRMVAYDSSEISQIDKLKVLKYIRENLAVDGPGGRARQKSGAEK